MKKTLLALVAILSVNAYAGTTLDKIKDSGKVVLGVRASSAPFSSVQADGSYDGYAVAICKDVVSALSKDLKKPLTIEYKEVDTTTRYTLIDSGVIDLECAGSSYNAEKLAVANYSIHFTDSILAAGKTGTTIKDLNDLSKARVGMVGSFSGEKAIRQFFTDKGVEITESNLQKAQNYDALFLLLKQKRIDAIITNKAILVGEIAKQKDSKGYVVLEETKIKENDKLGIVSPAKDQEFTGKVKETVKGLYKDGTLENYSKKYFSAPLSSESKRDIADNK